MFFHLKAQTDGLCLLLNYFFRSTNNTVWFFYKHFICDFYFLWYILNNALFQFLSVLFLIVCVSMSSIVGSIFLTIHFKHFVFIEWFDLNSDSSSLFERPSIRDFLFDFLMCLRILFFSLKMLNFFSSGLILINTQSSSFSSAFCLSISLLRFLSACPNSSASIASKDQSYNIKHCIEFAYLLLQMTLLLILILLVL